MLRKKSLSDRELWANFTKEIQPHIDELTEFPEDDRSGYYFDQDRLELSLSSLFARDLTFAPVSIPSSVKSPGRVYYSKIHQAFTSSTRIKTFISHKLPKYCPSTRDRSIKYSGKFISPRLTDCGPSPPDRSNACLKSHSMLANRNLMIRIDMSLIYLPPEIGQMQSLTMLSLDGCQISSLPATIGSLTHLIHLYLTRTLLLTLPAEIGGLSALRTLDLRDSSIIALPPEIGQLQSLTNFLLSGSRIETLPSSIGSLNNLELLDLIDTPITALPPEIGRLSPICVKRFPSSIPAPIIELLSTIEGCRRYAEYPTYLIEKVRNNLSLESADRAYPWYARFASVLEPICHQYNNATAREIIALIQYDQPTIDVILNSLDLSDERSHNLRKRRIFHSR